jgi:hypothetical protein
VNEELLGELSAGKLDVLELLEPDVVRLWIEVVEGTGRIERARVVERYAARVGDVAEDFFVDGDDWLASVFPDPHLASAKPIPVRRVADQTFADLGLLPGSTLRFERRAPTRRRRPR